MDNKILDIIHNPELSKVYNNLKALLKKSIKITITSFEEKNNFVGCSKIGGTPDFPLEWEWPSLKDIPLAFICQLNLKELNTYLTENELPSEGMIYFFYDAYRQPWGFDPDDKGSCSVLFYDGDIESLKIAQYPSLLPDECKFDSCMLKFKEEFTMPTADSIHISKLKLSKNELAIYNKIEEMANTLKEEQIYRILGYADSIQDEMEVECALVTNGVYCGDTSWFNDPRNKKIKENATDWQLLLQIDSNEEIDMMWGDNGRIYFWIKKEDLRLKKFQNVWLILQCY